MTKAELITMLNSLEVNPSQYSLQGELIPDAIILTETNTAFEVCYFDEKGTKTNPRRFACEDAACLYILNQFIESKRIEKDFDLNT